MRKRKANWIGHILHRNCLLQRVTEGKIKGVIEVKGRRGRIRRKLLDHLKEMRGYFYLKEEALDRTIWRARFGRGLGPVVRENTKWINELEKYWYLNFNENPSSGSRVVPYGWTDRLINVKKLIVASRNFANATDSKTISFDYNLHSQLDV
jgi:hypothetical protein